MGNENSNKNNREERIECIREIIYYDNPKYDRGKKIKELKQQSDKETDDTLKMYNDPKNSTLKILTSWEERDKIDDEIKRLEKMDEIEKNFKKNINLDEYRNDDGTFNIYRTKRSLNFSGGEASNSIIKKFHH